MISLIANIAVLTCVSAWEHICNSLYKTPSIVQCSSRDVFKLKHVKTLH